MHAMRIQAECMQFARLPEYHQKLLALKRDMNVTEEKVARLQQRSIRLHVKRDAHDAQMEKKRQKELELEEQLTAKPAKSLLEQQQLKAQAHAHAHAHAHGNAQGQGQANVQQPQAHEQAQEEAPAVAQ